MIFSLRLSNLKESHAGFYTCEASNSFQTITSTGFVRVKNSSIHSLYLLSSFHFDSFLDIDSIDDL